jgi:hypothetical protein
MRQPIDMHETIAGRHEQVAPILRLEQDFDEIVREPLDELRVTVGGGTLGRPVTAEIGPVLVGGRCVGIERGTLEIPVRWRAARHAVLFPTMRGRLVVRNAGYHTIVVRLVGTYRPPFGPLGWIIDWVFGRHAATASLERYLHTVATRLEATLRKHQPPIATRRLPAHAVERSP